MLLTSPVDVRGNARKHTPTSGPVSLIPLLPISLNDAQTWNLPQNPGYSPYQQ